MRLAMPAERNPTVPGVRSGSSIVSAVTAVQHRQVRSTTAIIDYRAGVNLLVVVGTVDLYCGARCTIHDRPVRSIPVRHRRELLGIFATAPPDGISCKMISQHGRSLNNAWIQTNRLLIPHWRQAHQAGRRSSSVDDRCEELSLIRKVAHEVSEI